MAFMNEQNLKHFWNKIKNYVGAIANGKADVNHTHDDMFVVETYQSNVYNTAANTTVDQQVMHISKDGYYPIGIVGHGQTYNSTGMYVNLNYAYLANRIVGACDIRFRFRNSATSAALNNFRYTFYVLWKKQGEDMPTPLAIDEE